MAANRGLAVAGALVAAILGGWFYSRSNPPEPAPVPIAAPVPEAAPPAQAETPIAAEATPDPSPDPSPDPVVEAPEIPAPSLSVVRVTDDGGALVSGRGLSGAAITINVDGAPVAEAATDSAGEFVAMFDLGYSAAAQILTLEMLTAEGQIVLGTDSVILVPRPAPVIMAEATPEPVIVSEATTEPQPEELSPETEQIALASPASEPAPEAISADPEATATVAAEEEPAPAAPSDSFILREGGEVVVLNAAPQVLDSVVVDAISYDDGGDLVISGRARADQGASRVQLYLDNRPVALAEAEAPGGGWAADLAQVDPGVYALRVDEIDAEGQVISRFETPFQREEPEVLANAQAQTAAQGPSVTLITVQPGHTLWHISAAHYGEGIRYVQVFNANRGQIRNPDLIFPGQVFVLPEE